MMADAVKLKELPSEMEHRTQRRQTFRKRRTQRDAGTAAKAAFEGKAFADLTGGEKDDLLKALAIMAGLVEE